MVYLTIRFQIAMALIPLGMSDAVRPTGEHRRM